MSHSDLELQLILHAPHEWKQKKTFYHLISIPKFGVFLGASIIPDESQTDRQLYDFFRLPVSSSFPSRCAPRLTLIFPPLSIKTLLVILVIQVQCFVLRVWSIGVCELLRAVVDGQRSRLLGELHIGMLRIVQADMEEAHATGAMQVCYRNSISKEGVG